MTDMTDSQPTIDRPTLLREIEAANQRIRNRFNDYEYVFTTPLRRSARLELRLGCERLFIKFENIQRGGSFKMRGATNAVACGHDEDPNRTFVAASAGNHGLGLAVASYHYGHPCHIFMPDNTPVTKKATIGLYTSNIHMGGENYDATQKLATEFAEAKGHAYVHAFNDPRVIAGQGTIGLELEQQFRDSDEAPPDYVLIPVGGGGLLAGLGTVLKDRWPDTQIIAVEPELIASLSAARGQAQPVRIKGEPTLADGVAVAQVGSLTLPIMNEVVDDIVTVSENAIATAIVKLIEDGRVVVEGAGAVGLAAVSKMVAGSPDFYKDKSFLILTSGGNLDISALSNALQRGLALESRRTHLQFIGRDIPGFLSEITKALAQLKLNIVELSHTRHNQYLNFGWTRVDVMVDTEGATHAKWALDRLRDRGFDVNLVSDR
ncbi:MAG: pyridoxal-phosphate dependent enzyme [candidate division Zixibacteria bacterium]|nr:pyridoxal-phosphate dependent enzyme [candidate division Zixibacteria bacterium]